MNENTSPLEENELTEEDLAILRAFDEMESWDNNARPESSSIDKNDQQKIDDQNDEVEMLLIFLEEVTDDIQKIHQALNQLEKEKQIDTSCFNPFRRIGHKIRGTSGAVGYMTMSTLAQYIENLAEQAQNEMIPPPVAYEAILQTATVLGFCQHYLEENAQEPDDPTLISKLQELYTTLNIDLSRPIVKQDTPKKATAATHPHLEDNASDTRKQSAEQLPLEEMASGTAFLRVTEQNIEHLHFHTAQLIEQHAGLESAQKNVTSALQDLQKAQDRLFQLEQALSTLARIEKSEQVSRDTITSSSLIARILNEASRETLRLLKNSKVRMQSTSKKKSEWDELDIEQYSEQDLILHDLREAIVEISICTARVNTAYATLRTRQEEYMVGVATVRHDTQILRLIPLRTLVPDLQQTIAESTLAKHHRVNFEFKDENIEIDQKVLAGLRTPLQQILSICMPDVEETTRGRKRTYQIWLDASISNNTIIIELGFSMPIQGGAVEAISETLQHINGTITFQRNTKGAVSFLLHFPYSQDTVSCLIVRVDNQLLAIPMNQIARIGIQHEEKFDACYSLHQLLALPHTHRSELRIQPVLLINRTENNMLYAILVDEIIGETELVIKPLQDYLQRPGISEYALDGEGNVLLYLNMVEALGYYINVSNQQSIAEPAVIKKNIPRILIAEDSAYQRQAIIHTLRHAQYQMELTEARDGMDAVEQMLIRPPDILLLDIEMPNLSGFDVLNLIRTNAEITTVKTIMLTSRDSEKHRKRAKELGARAYLTKPCHPETLLNTIQKLLA